MRISEAEMKLRTRWRGSILSHALSREGTRDARKNSSINHSSNRKRERKRDRKREGERKASFLSASHKVIQASPYLWSHHLVSIHASYWHNVLVNRLFWLGCSLRDICLLEHPTHTHTLTTRSAREVVLIPFLFCLAMFRTSLLINWVIIIVTRHAVTDSHVYVCHWHTHVRSRARNYSFAHTRA